MRRFPPCRRLSLIHIFVQRAKEAAGIDEIACRIARNIANGRWLWRNRLIASAIEIVVESETKELARFEDALKMCIRDSF